MDKSDTASQHSTQEMTIANRIKLSKNPTFWLH